MSDKTCKRCASPIDAEGWCTDNACPHNDWPQSVDMENDFDANGSLVVPQMGELRRVRDPRSR